MVDKALARNTRLFAERGEDGSRKGIAGILLRSVELDDGASTQHGMVRRVVLLGIVGMPGVGVVGRHHEGTFHGLMEGFLRVALRQGNALEHGGEERTACTLLRL